MKYTSTCVRQLTNRKGCPWVGILKYKDDDGKYRQVTKTFDSNIVKSRRAAEKATAEWRLDMEQAAEREADRDAQFAASGKTNPDRTTMTEFCARCIDVMESSKQIEKSTACDYRTTLKHFAEGDHPIADIMLSQLRHFDVREWEAGLMTCGGAKGTGVSAATVSKCHRFLHGCINMALADELILRDPTIGIHPPKCPSKMPNALDEAGRARVVQVLDTMEPTALKAAIALALFVGLRRGEVCGLRWSDIDFDEDLLTITHAIGNAGGNTYIKEPKTERSARRIIMPRRLCEILQARRAAMEDELRAANEAGGCETIFSNDLFVCGNIDGGYCCPDILEREWVGFAQAYNLIGATGKRITFHDLRHTSATLATAVGVDEQTVSALLGHSNPHMTATRYARPDDSAMKRAAKTIDDIYDSYEQNPPQAKVLELDRTGTDADE